MTFVKPTRITLSNGVMPAPPQLPMAGCFVGHIIGRGSAHESPEDADGQPEGRSCNSAIASLQKRWLVHTIISLESCRRWHDGQLACGHHLNKATQSAGQPHLLGRPAQGFEELWAADEDNQPLGTRGGNIQTV
jgi:hypothetical protein